MDTKLSIKVIAGSTREGRFSEHAAAWVTDVINAREDMTADLIDLREYDMPFFNEEETPSSKSAPYTHDAVARFTREIDAGDAFVLVTPEYNRGTSGVLKNAIDWVYQEWGQKPVSFVSYGNAGGARAVEQLRLNAIELQMAPIRTAVHIFGHDFFPVQFGDGDPAEMLPKYEKKATEMLDQLAWWARALKSARAAA